MTLFVPDDPRPPRKRPLTSAAIPQLPNLRTRWERPTEETVDALACLVVGVVCLALGFYLGYQVAFAIGGAGIN
jgi:hypothetical protein